MKSLFHALTSTFAMLIIATFWVSTVVSELFLGPQAVTIVKHSIAAYGVYALVLMMAGAGASGMALAKVRKGRLIDAKKRRMMFIAANGFLVLIPCALALDACGRVLGAPGVGTKHGIGAADIDESKLSRRADPGGPQADSVKIDLNAARLAGGDDCRRLEIDSSRAGCAHDRLPLRHKPGIDYANPCRNTAFRHFPLHEHAFWFSVCG